MHRIIKLKLKNYRNHENLEIEFPENKTVLIYGNNGIGKSNILEAIQLISTTKPLRATYDREIISHGKEFGIAEALIFKDEEIKLEVIVQSKGENNNSSKKVRLDGTAKKIGNFAGTLNSVGFAPSDMELITNSPSNRRKYMDNILYQTDDSYKKDLSNYTKAIKNRNKILERIRDLSQGRDQLPFWNKKILELGLSIQNKRKNMFGSLTKTLEQKAKELNNPQSSHTLVYKPNIINQERLLEYKEKEIMAKSTLIGPHRDDFGIHFDGRDLASFGSRGQIRTILLALKMAEMDYIYNSTGYRPVLLLDDIFSELDQKHKKSVLKIIEEQQTVITSATPIDELENFKNIHIIKI